MEVSSTGRGMTLVHMPGELHYSTAPAQRHATDAGSPGIVPAPLTEADVMGARAANFSAANSSAIVPVVSTSVGPGVMQCYFATSATRKLSALSLKRARDYVAALRPDLSAQFADIERDEDKRTLIDTWLTEHIRVTMRDVDDWARGVVRSVPLVLRTTKAVVRGSGDVPSDADDELLEFQIGLDEDEYTAGELEALYRQLRERDAPHDAARRELVLVQSLTLEQRAEDADREKGKRQHYENPYFSDSDSDSGTDTDGSDTEDEAQYVASDARKKATAKRIARESVLLKPKAATTKLSKLVETTKLSDSDIEEAESSRQDAINKVIFKKGQRPPKLFRKSPKFLYPSVKVADRAALPTKPTAQEAEDLAKLNELLAGGLSIGDAERQLASRFVVAQYRGLFYSHKSFTKRKRARHRGLDERNQPAFSSAALDEGSLGPGGFYYLNSAEGREGARNAYQSQILEVAESIKQTLLALRAPKPKESLEPTRKAVGRATENFKPTSLADISTHFYSQNYDAYHKALGQFVSGDLDEEDPLYPLFEGLTGGGNPKVSTGDVPTHAARYAYGLKPYKGHESEVLEPEYDEHGTPKHPYSGRIYVSLHPLTDYEENGPEALVELQRQKRINIGQVILPERETPFEGYLGAGRIKHQLAAKFPDFRRPYKTVYAEKYGLSKETFDGFREAIRATDPGSDERIFVEALLSTFLAMHAEIRAIEKAEIIARENQSRLIYRTGPKSFGIAPLPLGDKASSSSSSSSRSTTRKADAGAKKAVRKRAIKSGSPSSSSRSTTPSPRASASKTVRKRPAKKSLSSPSSSSSLPTPLTAAVTTGGTKRKQPALSSSSSPSIKSTAADEVDDLPQDASTATEPTLKPSKRKTKRPRIIPEDEP